MRFCRILFFVFLLLPSASIFAQEDLIDHFFDDVDFADTVAVKSDDFKYRIIDYITLHQEQEKDDKNRTYAAMFAVDKVLEFSVVSYDSYREIFMFLIDGFSALGYDDLVEFMANYPHFYEIKGTTESQFMELYNATECHSRVGIGKNAPEIDTVTVDGKRFSINTIDSKYVIVAFWSYDCPHCRDFMHEVGAFLDENPDFAIVAVNVIGTKREVKRLMRREKLKNSFFYREELEWQGPFAKAYAVNSLPSVFLLDESRTIVLKPMEISDLYDFVNNISR